MCVLVCRRGLCLGLFASKGFSNPLRSRGAGRYQLIEMTDNATLRRRRGKVLSSVLAAVCPFPTKFKKVWHLSRNGRTLYAWKPVAPDGFVALGMMCTVGDEPPPTSSMRCVPMAWCSPSKKPPFKIWDDTGSGGGKPGSFWIINSMDMLCVVAGHEPPQDTFYDLNSSRFYIDPTQLPKDIFEEK